MRIWLELNQQEGELLFGVVKDFTVDRMKTAVMGAPKEEPKKAKTEDKTVTVEAVRAVLAAKSQSGKQTEVKALIKKYGATKLTDIDPAKYAKMLAEAEVL